MIKRSYCAAFGMVCGGLILSFVLSTEHAIAQDGVTVKDILRRAQQESERAAVKALIDSFLGEKSTPQRKPTAATAPEAEPQETPVKTHAASSEPTSASAGDDPAQAKAKTSKSALVAGPAAVRTDKKDQSSQPVSPQQLATSQTSKPITIESRTPEGNPFANSSRKQDSGAEPRQEHDAKLDDKRLGSPIYSTAHDAAAAGVETERSAQRPTSEPTPPHARTNRGQSEGDGQPLTLEVSEAAEIQLRPPAATSSSEAAHTRDDAITDSYAPNGPVAAAPASRETTNMPTEDEADGTGPGTVHQRGTTKETAISAVPTQARLSKKKKLTEPATQLATLPASIRNLTPDEALARAAEQQIPSVNIEVYFQRGRANLSEGTFLLLGAVGRALSDPQLKNTSFMIAGHSDAKGRRETNRVLSAQRAQAVRDFLIQNFDIAPDRLVAKGFGEDHPKNPRQPYADINRRVQIINLTGITTLNP